MARTKLTERMAIRTKVFGATATILVIFSGLFKLCTVRYYPEEMKENKRTINWLQLYHFFYMSSALWSIEDFRITLFVKSPAFVLINWACTAEMQDIT
jgi:hypothetical protein